MVLKLNQSENSLVVEVIHMCWLSGSNSMQTNILLHFNVLEKIIFSNFALYQHQTKIMYSGCQYDK